jgi:hypothetical protein
MRFGRAELPRPDSGQAAHDRAVGAAASDWPSLSLFRHQSTRVHRSHGVMASELTATGFAEERTSDHVEYGCAAWVRWCRQRKPCTATRWASSRSTARPPMMQPVSEPWPGSRHGLSRLVLAVDRLPSGDVGPVHLLLGEEVLHVVRSRLLVRAGHGESRVRCGRGCGGARRRLARLPRTEGDDYRRRCRVADRYCLPGSGPEGGPDPGRGRRGAGRVRRRIGWPSRCAGVAAVHRGSAPRSLGRGRHRSMQGSGDPVESSAVVSWTLG